jgi:hypothetical protein
MFITAGLTGMRLEHIVGAFLVSRLSSYTFLGEHGTWQLIGSRTCLPSTWAAVACWSSNWWR